MGKQVVIGSEARTRMLEGVDILANAVKATLGPRGRHVAIARTYGPPLITKDGVTVARQIELDDEIQNMGAQLVRSVAAAANNQAGDGTTTATVLAQAIYSEGLKRVEEDGLNPVLLKRGIDLAVSKIVARIAGLSAKIADEGSMAQVATISANNDVDLGAMIAEAIATVGNDGVVSVEEATGRLTSVHYTEGLKLDRGILSEFFITNQQKLTAELDDCLVLAYDGKINSIHELVPLLEQVIESNKPFLLVVKDIEADALAQIVYNQIQGAIRCCVIKSPGFGDARKAFLSDLALITGGRLFTDEDGRGLKDAKLEELGSARRVVSSVNSTMVIDGNAIPGAVTERVAELKAQLLEAGVHEHQRELISNRVARLTGGVAVFRVGGTSESEMKERKDRVEDAINAVRSAIEEGVVPGGGAALIHASPVLDEIERKELMPEEVAGIEIVERAILSPFKQILFNAGVLDERSHDEFITKIKTSDSPSGYDALRMEYEDEMLQRGIMDPAKVVRCALQQAASASGTLLTTEVSIFELSKE